jgi:DNA-binding NtrC family response regulator
MNYDWPGNVREMENVIDRAIILADGNHITLADLPPQINKVDQLIQLGDSFQPSGTLREQVRKYEAALIFKTIEETGGDRRAAAQKLNIGLSSLYRKLEELEEQKALPEGSHARHEVRRE